MPNIAPDFSSDSRRIKGRIPGYATLDATQKPDQKTSEMGSAFISTALRSRPGRTQSQGVYDNKSSVDSPPQPDQTDS